MDKETFVVRAEEVLKRYDVCEVDVSDGTTMDIQVAEGLLGGTEGNYASTHLGNFEYETVKGVAEALYDFIKEIRLDIFDVREGD